MHCLTAVYRFHPCYKRYRYHICSVFNWRGSSYSWIHSRKHKFFLFLCFPVARKIAIKRGLTDVKITERETASFEVELSHPNVPGTWIRNGIQLKPTNHFRMSAKGQVHSLTISNLSVEDTGTFVFCVDNQKTSARLVVKGRWLKDTWDNVLITKPSNKISN